MRHLDYYLKDTPSIFDWVKSHCKMCVIGAVVIVIGSIIYCFRGDIYRTYLLRKFRMYSTEQRIVYKESDDFKEDYSEPDWIRIAGNRAQLGYCPQIWVEFWHMLRPSSTAHSAMGFLHERLAANGTPRIIDTHVKFDGSNLEYSKHSESFRRAPIQIFSRSTSIDGVFTRRGQPAEALNMPINCGNIRIYAGQPDPVDHSHFTMKYEIDNFPGTLYGTIDGWLQNDDTVKMQFRDDPAKLVATMPAMQSSFP